MEDEDKIEDDEEHTGTEERIEGDGKSVGDGETGDIGRVLLLLFVVVGSSVMKRPRSASPKISIT